MVKNLPANAGDARIPGLGRSPGGGHGNPLQYSCLENPMHRGVWPAMVHGVAKSQTRLSSFSLNLCITRPVFITGPPRKSIDIYIFCYKFTKVAIGFNSLLPFAFISPHIFAKKSFASLLRATQCPGVRLLWVSEQSLHCSSLIPNIQNKKLV